MEEVKQIFAIDPGTTESGFCIVDYDTMRPLTTGKVKNEDLLDIIRETIKTTAYENCRRENPVKLVFVLERISSYGQAVGREVFETCEWVGRFWQAVEEYRAQNIPVHFVYRKDEKQTICGSMKANDATIRRALIDKYAQHDLRTGKGTKNNPDWFYGFKKDCWSAFACAEAFKEMERMEG